MKSLKFINLTFIIAVAALTACSLLNSDDDEIERTFPEAFDLELTTIEQLRNEISSPDSLNIEAFVISRIICPPNAVCVLPDGIILDEATDDTTRDKQLFLSVEKPQQFQEEQQYVVSINIRTNESGTRTFFNLLGYSPVEIEK